jgi:hypothetical protein
VLICLEGSSAGIDYHQYAEMERDLFVGMDPVLFVDMDCVLFVEVPYPSRKNVSCLWG